MTFSASLEASGSPVRLAFCIQTKDVSRVIAQEIGYDANGTFFLRGKVFRKGNPDLFLPSFFLIAQAYNAFQVSAVVNLKGERIGITIFDGAAMQVLPLTNDYAALAETIENMSSGSNIRNYANLVRVDGRYSLIGNGLVNCVNNMGEKDQDTRARAVILATDNDGQTGSDTINLSLEQAGEYAKSRGIIIYGIDTNESERKTENYGYHNSSREFEDVVSNTKGAYVRLGQNKSLSVSMITESIMASLEKYTLSDAKRIETDAPNNYIIA